jgi:hypothetical protein
MRSQRDTVGAMDELENVRWLGDAAPDFVADTKAAYNNEGQASACPFCNGSGLIAENWDGSVVMVPCACGATP